MVEQLFFGYEPNSKREADFVDAAVELKCTPLLNSKTDGTYRIKERLVCTMIDYFELAETDFENSHLLSKCRLMLLLFYLHVYGVPSYECKFIFRVLWQLPDKDLLLIKQDYDLLADRVRRGEAHLISEGDTMYLGACRKGQKGDTLRTQPFSDIKAPRRAFSLKPAYMRYILSHVVDSESTSYTNYIEPPKTEGIELVTESDLKHKSFDEIIVERFRPFLGMDYLQMCEALGVSPYQSKSKYADVCSLIASQGKTKRVSSSDEFIKSGLVMKTIRLRMNGMPKEAMSFKNIDYQEVYDNDEWTDSEVYELFSNRFLFVVLKPVQGKNIQVFNRVTGEIQDEQSYLLDNVFFWTMPQHDLETARLFWEDVRSNVLTDNIRLDAFWSIADDKKFHVRPKASNAQQLTANPNGGLCPKYSYWFNANYVKSIIDKNATRL